MNSISTSQYYIVNLQNSTKTNVSLTNSHNLYACLQIVFDNVEIFDS